MKTRCASLQVPSSPASLPLSLSLLVKATTKQEGEGTEQKKAAQKNKHNDSSPNTFITLEMVAGVLWWHFNACP